MKVIKKKSLIEVIEKMKQQPNSDLETPTKSQQSPTNSNSSSTQSPLFLGGCYKCQKTFLDPILLLKHLNLHVPDLFHANILEDSEIESRNLIPDSPKINLGSSLSLPVKCETDYPQPSTIPMRNISPNMVSSSGVEYYMCPTCSNTFQDDVSYSAHLQAHQFEENLSMGHNYLSVQLELASPPTISVSKPPVVNMKQEVADIELDDRPTIKQEIFDPDEVSQETSSPRPRVKSPSVCIHCGEMFADENLLIEHSRNDCVMKMRKMQNMQLIQRNPRPATFYCNEYMNNFTPTPSRKKRRQSNRDDRPQFRNSGSISPDFSDDPGNPFKSDYMRQLLFNNVLPGPKTSCFQF